MQSCVVWESADQAVGNMSSSPTSLAATPPAPKGSRTVSRRDISKCNGCDCRFTWLNHRHRCGSCLEAVCNACSRNRKALPGYIAPKRICDTCIRVRWAPKDATVTRDETALDTKPPASDRNDRRLSVTMPTPDANALDSTATAPLSPGSPPAVFFGPDSVIASTAAEGEGAGAAAEVAVAVAVAAGEEGEKGEKRAKDDDGLCLSSSSSHGRHRRGTCGVAMLPSPPAAPPSPSSAVSILPPRTPAGALEVPQEGGTKEVEDGEHEREGEEVESLSVIPTRLATPPASPTERTSGATTAAVDITGGDQGDAGERVEDDGEKEDDDDHDRGNPALATPTGGESADEEEEAEGKETAESPLVISTVRATQRALPEERSSGAAVDIAEIEVGDEGRRAGVEAAEGGREEEGEGEDGEGSVPTATWKALAMAGVAVGTGVAVAVLVLRVVGRGRK